MVEIGEKVDTILNAHAAEQEKQPLSPYARIRITFDESMPPEIRAEATEKAQRVERFTDLLNVYTALSRQYTQSPLSTKEVGQVLLTMINRDLNYPEERRAAVSEEVKTEGEAKKKQLELLVKALLEQQTSSENPSDTQKRNSADDFQELISLHDVLEEIQRGVMSEKTQEFQNRATSILQKADQNDIEEIRMQNPSPRVLDKMLDNFYLVIHDIRTPVTVMTGYTSYAILILRKQVEQLSTTISKTQDRVQKSIEKITTVIENKRGILRNTEMLEIFSPTELQEQLDLLVKGIIPDIQSPIHTEFVSLPPFPAALFTLPQTIFSEMIENFWQNTNRSWKAKDEENQKKEDTDPTKYTDQTSPQPFFRVAMRPAEPDEAEGGIVVEISDNGRGWPQGYLDTQSFTGTSDWGDTSVKGTGSALAWFATRLKEVGCQMLPVPTTDAEGNTIGATVRIVIPPDTNQNPNTLE